jgi:hypothetical protein
MGCTVAIIAIPHRVKIAYMQAVAHDIVAGRCFEHTFPLPPCDRLAVIDHEKGLTLLDHITTRAQLERSP